MAHGYVYIYTDDYAVPYGAIFPIKRVNCEFLAEQRRTAMANRFPRNLCGRTRRYRRRLSNDAFEDASAGYSVLPGRIIEI